MGSETPSVYFPVDPLFEPSFAAEAAYSVLVKPYLGGAEQRRDVFPDGGQSSWSGPTIPLDLATRKLIRDFWDLLHGQRDPFWFFEPMPEGFTDRRLATGDGAATTVTLGVKASASVSTVKVNGVSKSVTFSAGTGAGGEDRVTFSAYTPPNGSLITVTSNGRLRYPARFNMQKLPRKFLDSQPILGSFALNIQEVL